MKKRHLLGSYFVRPPRVHSEGYVHHKKTGARTYSEYNYLRPGIASYFRTRHFEHALLLTREHFHKCNVIDFGCGDGPFLPSLAKYFNRVLAIDKHPKYIELASKVVSSTGLDNVELLCNRDLTSDDIKSKMGNENYHILYLLETLEHVGDKSNLWGSRVDFIKELSGLIDESGMIVISVPKMIGISFLLQRLGLFLSGAHREPISMNNVLRASLFDDTTDLEKRWQGGHLGFNHKKLESHLGKEFHILKKKTLLFQLVYVCQRRVTDG